MTATGVPSLSDLDRVFAVMAERPLMVAGAGSLSVLASMIPQLHVRPGSPSKRPERERC